MGALKFKEHYPEDTKEKQKIDELKKAIGELVKDPKNSKKAALILEKMLHNKK